MFTYTAIKENNPATITMSDSYPNYIYVEPEPQWNEDLSEFSL